MKIVGKVKEKRYQTVEDLSPGDVFVFENAIDEVYLMSQGEYVSLSENCIAYDIDSFEDIPVRKINAELVIKDLAKGGQNEE